MMAHLNPARDVGLLLGRWSFVGLSPLTILSGCEVTTGPAGTFSDAATQTGPAAVADAGPGSMASEDPRPGSDGGQGCPATAPASCDGHGGGQACSQVGANCNYGDVCCTCGAGMMQWYCAKTDAPDPCPADPPQVGLPCNLDLVGCMYCTPHGLFTAACSQQAISFYAPQCEATIPSMPAVVDAGSTPRIVDAGATAPPDSD